MASRALTDFLNNMIFGHSVPVRQFAAALGADGGRAGTCLLEGIRCNIPRHSFLSLTARPPGLPSSRASTRHSCTSQSECCGSLMRRRTLQQAAAHPIVTSSRNQRYLRGGNLLCAYGPLFFPMLEAVLPKLSPIHWEYV